MNKFIDNLNTAVFTTRFVIKEKSTILNVYHFEDGSWQFSGAEKDIQDEDYKIVSLAEILALDSTLGELGILPKGFEAKRRTLNDEWKIISAN